ncbi:hypothetical protein [Sporosalibacterium faouarense]|uniref:baeRF7 domain-containing protein n=1 Tax=Sporosalibacterium faouarense TaxID=516123 RepID=UPI00192CD611|nr:hypothetical protein [Sporosalibacterium faouarense]
MELFRKDDLKNLIEKGDGNCISIFISTKESTGRNPKGAIKLKNFLKKSEDQLESNGLKSSNIDKILKPAKDLVEDSHFWNNRSDGLAVFISEDYFVYYHLPLEFHDEVIIENDFYIKPLLPLVTEDGIFYILTLSQNDIKLLHCTRENISEIGLKDIPTSLSEALKYDDPEKQIQYSSHRGTGGRNEALYFGNGDSSEDSKQDIVRFFRKIDKGLHDILNEENAPIILAGVDFLLPLYKKVNTYSNLMEEGIVGNPEDISLEKLHNNAWEIVNPYFKEEKIKSIDEYKNLRNTNSTSNNLEKIVSSAYFKRIDKLFVADGHQKWGEFNPTKNKINMMKKEESSSEDLLNFAAIHTLINGGEVYKVESEEISGENLAAILRY